MSPKRTDDELNDGIYNEDDDFESGLDDDEEGETLDSEEELDEEGEEDY